MVGEIWMELAAATAKEYKEWEPEGDETSRKELARQNLGQILAQADREIAEGKATRDFEETFAAIQKRLERV